MVTVSEWESIKRSDFSSEDWESLESIALENDDFLRLTAYKGERQIIARNYVGLIGFHDGQYLEILPKIGDTDQEKKDLFVRMLSVATDVSWKITDKSPLDVQKENIFEFFIEMYVKEMRTVLNKGLNSNYHKRRNNCNFLKGKLIFNENIKRNAADDSSFYVEYQVFDHDSSENRIVKATLERLSILSHDSNNKRKIRNYLSGMTDVSRMKDVKQEFQRCVKDRNTTHYCHLLEWSRLILNGTSMNTFKGTTVSFIFLFPMEIVFERYVANILKKNAPDDWIVSTQDRTHYLFDDYSVPIRPDIVLYHGEKTLVIDTKWKDPDEKGVSVDDLYQMYIYSRKFESKTTVLLYPECKNRSKYTEKTKRVNIVTEEVEVGSVDLTVECLNKLIKSYC